jgi:hypothetical protein
MPFSGGTFTKLFNWLTDPQRSEKIFNSRLDDEFGGIATGLSTAILKNGATTTTAAIPFAQGISLSDGSLGTPAANFINDTNTGFYRITTDRIGIVTNGALAFDIGTAVIGTYGSVGGTQSNAALTIRASLGQNSLEWGNSNTAGFGSTIGYFSGAGSPFVAFNMEAGTNADTFRTRGLKGMAIVGQNGSGLKVQTVANSSADNQTPVDLFTFSQAGVLSRPSQPAFSAHKNGTNQGSIATATFTKVTFETEVFDVGGFYNNASGASGSRWTPPAGKVMVIANVFWSAGTTSGTFIASIYKKGVRFKDNFVFNPTATAAFGNQVVIIDDADGTDYYEAFVFGATGTSLTVDGTISATYFMGYML